MGPGIFRNAVWALWLQDLGIIQPFPFPPLLSLKPFPPFSLYNPLCGKRNIIVWKMKQIFFLIDGKAVKLGLFIAPPYRKNFN